jgi:DNA-binding NarL/FixJ family response regulator
VERDLGRGLHVPLLEAFEHCAPPRERGGPLVVRRVAREQGAARYPDGRGGYARTGYDVMMGTRRTPEAVRIAVMDDYEVIVSGVQQMLAPFEQRVRVVEAVSLLPVESEIDLLLYDTYSHEQVGGQPEQVIAETDAKVVLYTWSLAADLVEEALAKGARGCISKSVTAPELVDALERVNQGEIVVSDDPGPDAPLTVEAWPGKEHGLSPRESEVIALIAQGLSNDEVAERAFLSVNSVKTYIRSAYRKIGVERRTQAVIWATTHGFVPTPARHVLPAMAPPETE